MGAKAGMFCVGIEFHIGRSSVSAWHPRVQPDIGISHRGVSVVLMRSLLKGGMIEFVGDG